MLLFSFLSQLDFGEQPALRQKRLYIIYFHFQRTDIHYLLQKLSDLFPVHQKQFNLLAKSTCTIIIQWSIICN